MTYQAERIQGVPTVIRSGLLISTHRTVGQAQRKAGELNRADREREHEQQFEAVLEDDARFTGLDCPQDW